MIEHSSAPASRKISRPALVTALGRGLRRHCPFCDAPAAFSGYLKVAPACTTCGAELGKVRADDAPPYFTIVIVGHIVIPLMLVAEQLYGLSTAVHAALWLPLTAVLTLGLLPYVKGATLGLMAAIGITGTESSEHPPV